MSRGIVAAARGRNHRRRGAAIVATAALALATTACGGTGTAISTSTDSPTTTAAVPPTAITTTVAASTTVGVVGFQDILDGQVDGVVGDSDGAAMIAVVETDGTVHFAADGSGPDGEPPTPDAVFRIGSVTKMFTSAVLLQLVDDGLVDLDAPVSDYVTRLATPEGVTVRDLLQHTSGIANYTDDVSFVSRAVADPERAWTPEETFALVANKDALFEPGSRFSYSNTNYLVVGVLIEEVTGSPFAEVLRARVLEPLGLTATYVAGFEEGPEPFPAYTRLLGASRPIDFAYTAIATDAWAAGAIVSSIGDLATFMAALFDGRVVSQASLDAMTGDLRSDYGLGIIEFSVGDVYGHGGGIPGYGTLVMHAPETGSTAVWVVTNDAIDISRTIAPVAASIAP